MDQYHALLNSTCNGSGETRRDASTADTSRLRCDRTSHRHPFKRPGGGGVKRQVRAAIRRS